MGFLDDYNLDYDYTPAEEYVPPAYYTPGYDSTQDFEYTPVAQESYGGYEGLGIGNPSSYGGDTVLPTYGQGDDSSGSWYDILDKGLGALSAFGRSNVGSALGSLGSAALAAYGANKQNKLIQQAQAKHDEAVAAAKAEAAKYNEPLRLINPRTAVGTPVARQGASEWFINNAAPKYYANGGLSQVSDRYVKGGSPGQADMIQARLSDGEYVFDADSVAALGDGNNEAGAAKLDQMRENIRAHKRSASPKRIPPKAKSTQAYMKGVK